MNDERNSLAEVSIEKIRLATPDDANDILQIVTMTASEGRALLSEPEELLTSPEATRAWMEQHLLEQPIFAAEVEGKVVGFVEVERCRRRRLAHVALLSFYVRLDWRELGIGGRLMERVIEWALEHPEIEKLTLSVLSSNQAALDFFTRHGFEEEGRRYREVRLSKEEYLDEVLMARWLV